MFSTNEELPAGQCLPARKAFRTTDESETRCHGLAPSLTSERPAQGADLSQKIPSYLKLHVEEAAALATPVPTPKASVLSELQDSFTEATGWSFQVPNLNRDTMDDKGHPYGLTKQTTSGLDKNSAQRLANSIGSLVDELQTALTTVWHREAELATGIPVCERTDEDEHLANRLEAVLKAGAMSVQCNAAALYLLDDATSELKLRACWGLPISRLMDPARPLRGAVADLEALIGHAVVLEDVSRLPHWKPPEQFASAVCVPVASPSTPLGTAWFFCDETRTFSDTETQILEVIAGRLAADLEREVLLAEGTQSAQMQRELHQASQWQNDRLPNLSPMIEGWQFAGWAEQALRLGGAFYDWQVLEDSRLSLSLGQAQGTMLESALNAASVHASLKAMSNREHEVPTIFERLNDSLWTSSAGDQYASLFHGRIDPEAGTLEASIAGNVAAAIIRPRSVKTLSIEQVTLGQQPDHRYRTKSFKMQPGDILAVVNESIVNAVDDDGTSLWDRITKSIQKSRDLSPDQLLEQARLLLDSYEPQRADLALLIVKHV